MSDDAANCCKTSVFLTALLSKGEWKKKNKECDYK